MKMIFDYNGNKTVIFSEEKRTTYKEIIDNIRDISLKTYVICYHKTKSIQSIYNEYELKINEMLNQLNNSIIHQKFKIFFQMN